MKNGEMAPRREWKRNCARLSAKPAKKCSEHWGKASSFATEHHQMIFGIAPQVHVCVNKICFPSKCLRDQNQTITN